MKIIGICGSPLPNGNTAKLIKRVLKGAESVGAKTEFISLGNKNLLFCRSCYMCAKYGKCILKDDLNKIREKMIKCDGIVIGSPTYEREITGQMKTFFDRLWFDIHKETFLGKHAVYVNTHSFTIGHSAKTLKELCIGLGYSVVSSVISNNLGKFNGKIENDKKTLKKAYKIGIKLVNDIKQKKRYFLEEFIRKHYIKPILKKVYSHLERNILNN